ncbi:MAG TPA: hydroxymethylbilane synthase [Verrucomicrobiales bacterium]|nr:hydroxymethylbilane synthase [Verrucomicrobiales bacterium]
MSPDPLSTLYLGTRGSDLALAQEGLAREALKRAHPHVKIFRKIIRTTGDRRSEAALSGAHVAGVMDKGMFIRELELALQSREIDAAVHSLKDVPADLPDAFVLAAFLPRAPVHDVVLSLLPLSQGVASLPSEARVGTASVRRKRQLLWERPDLQIVEMRGNVPTRVDKLLAPGGPDAIVLAFAGLQRLGWVSPADGHLLRGDRTVHCTGLDPARYPPSAGQGAVALEIRTGDERLERILSAVDHLETRRRVLLERRFLQLLEAGCLTPVGVYTAVEKGVLHASAQVFREDDDSASPVCATAEGPANSPEEVAGELFSRLQPLTRS